MTSPAVRFGLSRVGGPVPIRQLLYPVVVVVVTGVSVLAFVQPSLIRPVLLLALILLMALGLVRRPEESSRPS